jgi:hypothetical protein
VKIEGAIHLPAGIWRFENVWLSNTLEVDAGGMVELRGCAARRVEVHTSGTSTPVVSARAAVIDRLLAPRGRIQLEYVTVLERLVAEAMDLSDCLIVPTLQRDIGQPEPPDTGCARYSRLASQALAPGFGVGRGLTRVKPWFVSEVFGQPGCAVLHPGAHAALRSGAEDGGEMGAYHDLRIALREQAVLTKLQDYLPVGLEPVLIPDPTLRCPPPTPTSS